MKLKYLRYAFFTALGLIIFFGIMTSPYEEQLEFALGICFNGFWISLYAYFDCKEKLKDRNELIDKLKEEIKNLKKSIE